MSADPVDSVADAVLGQTNFVTNACNNGGLVDAAGNVYVVDEINHRVT